MARRRIPLLDERPSLLARAARLALLTALAVGAFALGLSILVLAVTD